MQLKANERYAKTSKKNKTSIVGLKDVLQATGLPEVSIDCVKKAASHVGLTASRQLQGFQYIKNYMTVLKNMNPDLEYALDPPEGEKFNRLMVLLPHSVNAFPHCYPVVGIDTAHMDPLDLSGVAQDILETVFSAVPVDRALFKCKLVCISAYTVNKEQLPFAFMISMSEANLDIAALLKFCNDMGLALNRSNVTVLSDRSRAIIGAIEDHLTLCLHMLCPKHLSNNLNTNGFTSPLLHNLFFESKKR